MCNRFHSISFELSSNLLRTQSEPSRAEARCNTDPRTFSRKEGRKHRFGDRWWFGNLYGLVCVLSLLDFGLQRNATRHAR
mmetsp:Transcript_4639/g.13383  ORF Transcript_4639/g.13383 Transcript_4639/m.13383 type:complete len:80 (+) Transcript_4639:38-277(+)